MTGRGKESGSQVCCHFKSWKWYHVSPPTVDDFPCDISGAVIPANSSAIRDNF